jgi:peroxiredoxin family protein
MDEREKPLSLVLFSGTDDKLNAAAVLTVGAAAMGRPVNVFLQYYALDAFRAGRVEVDHALSPEATAEQSRSFASTQGSTGASC